VLGRLVLPLSALGPPRFCAVFAELLAVTTIPRSTILLLALCFSMSVALAQSAGGNGATAFQSSHQTASGAFYEMALKSTKGADTHFFGETSYVVRRSPLAARLAADARPAVGVFEQPLHEATKIVSDKLRNGMRPSYARDSIGRDKFVEVRMAEFFDHVLSVAIYAHALEMTPSTIDSEGRRPQDFQYLAKSLALASRSLAQSLIGILSFTDPRKVDYQSVVLELMPSLSKLVPQEISRKVFVTNLIYGRAHSGQDGVSSEEITRREASSNFVARFQRSTKRKFEEWNLKASLHHQPLQPIYPQPLDNSAEASEVAAAKRPPRLLPRPTLLIEGPQPIPRCSELFSSAR
jgi:hypothetical protein